MLGWHGEDSAGSNLYQTTLLTSILEYGIILFFGVWLVTEYFYNIYEQQYFGSFNPVFLIVVLMIVSAYGFTRLVSTIRTVLKPPKKTNKPEDDY
ncbi:MAG TPA: hypothetical protein VEL71_07375 [Candidatus Dormibacteraeota bacterium]|nr:hypothetical protein [Candidatus Dormibacteraeota bacterium]